MAKPRKCKRRPEDFYHPPQAPPARRKTAARELNGSGVRYTGWYGSGGKGPPPQVHHVVYRAAYINPPAPAEVPQPSLDLVLPEAGTKSRRLWTVWERFDGTCQRCGCDTVPGFVARQWGWEVFTRHGLAVASDGTPYGLATIQHVLSRARGGTNDPHNLSLYCHNCNGADNIEVELGVPQPVVPGNDPESAPKRVRTTKRMGMGPAYSRWEDDGGRVPPDED